MGLLNTIKEKLRDRKFAALRAVDARPLQKRVDYYMPIIKKIYDSQSIDPGWGYAIAMQESTFRSTVFVVSGGDARVGGSFGLMQVSAKTASALGFVGDPSDMCIPEIGILWSARVLKDNIKWLKTRDFRDLSAAYNSGKPYGHAPASTRNVYVVNVLRYLSEHRQRYG